MRIESGMNSVSEQEKYARLQNTEAVKKAEKIGKPEESSKPDSPKVRMDEYVPSEHIKGIYKPGKDEDGNPKIDYIDPKKDNVQKPAKMTTSDPKKSESTTTDTDKVDREIEKLKEKKARLEQELRSADDSKKEELERQLKQVEAELVQKDNDNYRRQNAVIS